MEPLTCGECNIVFVDTDFEPDCELFDLITVYELVLRGPHSPNVPVGISLQKVGASGNVIHCGWIKEESRAPIDYWLQLGTRPVRCTPCGYRQRWVGRDSYNQPAEWQKGWARWWLKSDIEGVGLSQNEDSERGENNEGSEHEVRGGANPQGIHVVETAPQIPSTGRTF